MELNASTLLSDANLIAYYKLENTTDTKGGHTLTNNGSVAFSAGLFNNGANLGSANSSKSLTHADDLGIAGSSSQSGSCWIKLLAEIGSGYFHFVAHDTTNGHSEIYLRYDYNAGTRRLNLGRYIYGTGGTSVDLTYNITLGTSNWVHLAWVYNGSTLKLYVNGVERASGSTSGTGTGTNPYNQLTIGMHPNVSQYASAIIDDVSIFNRALSGTEVADLYAIKAWTQAVDDTGTLTEVFQKSPSRILTEIGTLTEVFIKSVSRIWSETHTLSEVFEKVRNTFFSPSETATLSETTSKAMTVEKTETGTLSEVFSAIANRFSSFIDSFTGFIEDFDTARGKGLEYIDTVTPTDSQEKSMTRNLSDTGTLTEVFSSLKNMFTSLVDSFTGFIEDLVIGQSKSKNLSDDISATDSTLRGVTRNQTDNATLSESFDKTRNIPMSLTDTSTLTDAITRAFTRIFSDTTSLLDRLKKYLNGSVVIQYLYRLKNTVFSNKYSPKSTTYSDKYTPKDTQY